MVPSASPTFPDVNIFLRIVLREMDKLTTTEVILMANNNPKNSKAGTNVQKVRQQNQMAQQGQYETEFASETDAQEVKRKNQKSQQNKK